LRYSEYKAGSGSVSQDIHAKQLALNDVISYTYGMKITQIKADFTQYPVYNPELLGLERDVDYPQELTLGDLSGNLLMLMWVLITAGMAKMSEENYLALAKLQQEINDGHQKSFHDKPLGKSNIPWIDYTKVTGITEEQKKRWIEILATITFNKNCNILLRLLGDEVADRLGDDSLTIDTLHKADLEGLDFRILGSNHLHLFVENFLSIEFDDDEEEKTYDSLLLNAQGVSLLSTIKSIENGVIDGDALRQKIHNVYSHSPRLKLIDYSKGDSDKEMALFVHAPFNLYRIVKVAEYFNITVPETFRSTDEVCKFIDQINEKFKETYADVYFSGAGKKDIPVLDDEAQGFAIVNSPVGALFWMKNYEVLDEDGVPECFNNIVITGMFHGHTDSSKKSSLPNRISLNSSCTQPSTSYTFPVAVSAIKSKKKLEVTTTREDTPSPVGLLADREPLMAPWYRRTIGSESVNSTTPSSPASGSGSATPTDHKTKY
jgi:hypothetical protein